jgi:hypothetical protein
MRGLPAETRLLGCEKPGATLERDTVPPGSTLVGLNVSVGKLRGFRLRTVVESVQAIYTKEDRLVEGCIFGKREGEVEQLRAKEGYAIGALQVNHGVQSLRPRYMRIVEHGLDTSDAYWGDWVGGPPFEHAPVICSFGRPIVGLTAITCKHLGIPHRYVKALGLVAAQEEAVTASPLAGYVFNLPGFQDRASGDGRLFGLRLTLGRQEPNCSSSITSIQPIYSEDDPATPGRVYGEVNGSTVELRARKGYAVGAIKIASASDVIGLQPVYMRVRDHDLDPNDTYADDWYGRSTPGTPSLLGGDGRSIVGLVGVADATVQALGVIQAGKPKPFSLALEEPRTVPKAESRDPILQMTFDEGTVAERHGLIVVDDLSGFENESIGEGVEIAVEGIHGGALALYGGRLELPRMLLNHRKQYTFSFWGFREATGEIRYYEFSRFGGAIFGWDHLTFLNAWNKKAGPNQWKGGIACDEGTPVGKWFFLAVAFQQEQGHEGTARVFVDDRVFTIPSHTVDSDLTGFATIEGSNAKIDELTVFPNALSDAELLELYERGKAQAAGH